MTLKTKIRKCDICSSLKNKDDMCKVTIWYTPIVWVCHLKCLTVALDRGYERVGE